MNKIVYHLKGIYSKLVVGVGTEGMPLDPCSIYIVYSTTSFIPFCVDNMKERKMNDDFFCGPLLRGHRDMCSGFSGPPNESVRNFVGFAVRSRTKSYCKIITTDGFRVKAFTVNTRIELAEDIFLTTLRKWPTEFDTLLYL